MRRIVENVLEKMLSTTVQNAGWAIRPSLSDLSFSPALLIHEHVFSLQQQGRTVYHMALEESPFPVHKILQEQLAAQVAKSAYIPSVGLFELKTLALQYFSGKLKLPPGNYRVIIGAGCPALVTSLQVALEGDLLFPVPSWVSYYPHTLVTGDKVIKIHTGMEDGYKLKPEVLEEQVRKARDSGYMPRKLFLNYPNDPAGITYAPDELEAIARVARANGILIISDETYGLVNFSGDHESISRYYPEGTVVVAGLSRHMALGGFRFAVSIIPENMERLFQTLRSITGETSANAASPLQYGVLSALQGYGELEEYIRSCTGIHRIIIQYLKGKLLQMGIAYPDASGAYFLYPDFSPFARSLKKKYGVSTSEALAESLLLERQVAALPGTAFGDRNEHLRLRLSALDYNGRAALEYREKFGLANEEHFVEACCPRIEEGMRRLSQYFLD